MKECECQNCEKQFVIENDEKVICPFCYSEDIIIYEEDNDEDIR